jgi:hypothetical protein
VVKAALKPSSQPPTPKETPNMFPNTNSTPKAAQTEKKAKKPGITFDVVLVTETVDDKTGEVKKTYAEKATLFIRESMENGVMYVKQGEGKPDAQYAVFRRKYKGKGAAKAA